MRVSNLDDYLGYFSSIQCDQTLDNFSTVKKHYRPESEYFPFHDGTVRGKRYKSDVIDHFDASKLKEQFQRSFKDKKLAVLKKIQSDYHVLAQ
eukprot:4926233-Ditylum_brightwellii.AAC.1